jgi:photosystem II stability/assembly factor-like uncharacterized protein
LNAVYFLDISTGWIVGGVGILKTTNSGMNWILQSSPTEWPINDICFINNDVGYAVEGGDPTGWSSRGSTLKTTNSGDTWVKLTADTTIAWGRVSFSDTQNGIIAGVESDVFGNFIRVFYTTDGGTNWIESNRGYEGYFTCIAFIDSSHAWASGSPYGGPYGVVLFSSDGGANWSIQSEYPYSLNNVYFINFSTGWAVGDSGKVLHTTNGGVSFVEEEQLGEVPNTTFRYSIPQSSQVVIRVFDMLGNEIETLVNEEKPSGYYELEFNASKLASGIYFYRIQAVPTGRQAGSFVETKKMVLMK